MSLQGVIEHLKAKHGWPYADDANLETAMDEHKMNHLDPDTRWSTYVAHSHGGTFSSDQDGDW